MFEMQYTLSNKIANEILLCFSDSEVSSQVVHIPSCTQAIWYLKKSTNCVTGC